MFQCVHGSRSASNTSLRRAENPGSPPDVWSCGETFSQIPRYASTADRTNATRLSVMSHQAYGPLTGVPRILRLLARQDLRATFFVPGYTAERYPDVVRRIVEAGHEIVSHPAPAAAP